jgi:hypothetical protein
VTPSPLLRPLDLGRVLGISVEEAGDCRGPRSLEEAIPEGTLAAGRAAERAPARPAAAAAG